MVKAVKRLKTQGDVTAFAKFKCYSDTLGMIHAMTNSVKGKKRSDVPAPSESSNLHRILVFQNTISKWVDEIPLHDMATQRFGNKAFRDFHNKLEMESTNLHRELLRGDNEDKYEELTSYILDSFGNATRIDYGTGHELHYLVWLRCLAILGFIVEEDLPALTLHVFWGYIDLMRKIQHHYQQEPAGSHGVWGLDDYHHLPFIFGASQLIDGEAENPPSIIADRKVVEELRREYLYLDCIAWIHANKKGPFYEHSSVLHNVSGVALWSKICSGMIKMYIGEVLSKFPIMQHFLFGELNKYE
eukprot:PhF_6_TR44517/c0_g1_i1/m.68569/K17605/PPP2R4, PTPA; serine/threonine-protein phosphatase 2A activator